MKRRQDKKPDPQTPSSQSWMDYVFSQQPGMDERLEATKKHVLWWEDTLLKIHGRRALDRINEQRERLGWKARQ